MNELLSTSQAVSHPSQNIGKVRKTASFYLFKLKYFCNKRFHGLVLTQIYKERVFSLFQLYVVIFKFSFQPFCLLWSLKNTGFLVSGETENSRSYFFTNHIARPLCSLSLFFLWLLMYILQPRIENWKRRGKQNKNKTTKQKTKAVRKKACL